MFKSASILILGLSASLVLIGCDSSPAEVQARPAAVIPPISLGTPEDATQTVLLTLQARLRVAAYRDVETAKKALSQLRYLASEADLMRGLDRLPAYKSLLGNDVIEGFVDNWAATVSYYAEGYRLDEMSRVFESSTMINDTPTEVHVIVPAAGKDDEAQIQVNCVYDESGDRWLIARVGFLGKASDKIASEATPAP